MNPEKPLSAKNVAALERMGSDRVMKDLRAKYGLDQVQAGPESQSSDQKAIPEGMGHDRVMADMQRRGEEQKRLLVGSSVVHETYSAQELVQIAEVREQLDMMVAEFNVRVAGLPKDSLGYMKEVGPEVAKMVAYLDSLPIWKFKFSTEIGASVVGPLKEDELDSLYYMTASGISMRLRRASLPEGYGLGAVVQPFMEKVRFCDMRAKRFESEPTLGLTVEDYASREFEERLKNAGEKDDFVSPLAVWMKDEKPVAFGGPDDVRIHNGDRVNKIFMSK